MKEETINRILAAGADLIHKNGFHNTGIQEILKAADVPKGSFYFYFKSKEDFGVRIIDYYLEMFGRMVSPILTAPDRSPIDKIRDLFDAYIAYFTGREFTCGCPVGNLGQELGDTNPRFRKRLANATGRMTAMYADLLRAAVAAGELPPETDIDETAHFIVSSWEGALLMMKLEKSATPLEIQKRMILERVLGRPC